MATIYVWRPGFKSVGHVSMKLSDGTYISHWPENKGIFKKYSFKPVKGKQNTSLEEDIKTEERDPDNCLELSEEFFDSSEISIWWKSYKKKLRYHFFTSNCAHVVCKALTKLVFKFSNIDFGELEETKFEISNPVLKTPYFAYELAKSITLKTKKIISFLCTNWFECISKKLPVTASEDDYYQMCKKVPKKIRCFNLETLDTIGKEFKFL